MQVQLLHKIPSHRLFAYEGPEAYNILYFLIHLGDTQNRYRNKQYGGVCIQYLVMGYKRNTKYQRHYT